MLKEVIEKRKSISEKEPKKKNKYTNKEQI
jgi:hypothetical protein